MFTNLRPNPHALGTGLAALIFSGALGLYALYYSTKKDSPRIDMPTQTAVLYPQAFKSGASTNYDMARITVVDSSDHHYNISRPLTIQESNLVNSIQATNNAKSF